VPTFLDLDGRVGADALAIPSIERFLLPVQSIEFHPE
jgi:hypothetical protein